MSISRSNEKGSVNKVVISKQTLQRTNDVVQGGALTDDKSMQVAEISIEFY